MPTFSFDRHLAAPPKIVFEVLKQAVGSLFSGIKGESERRAAADG
jgi:hypothetical protein